MTKAKISISIDGQLLDRIDELAARAGESRSEAMQRLCWIGVQNEAQDAPDVVRLMQFSGPLHEVLKIVKQWKPTYPNDNVELIIRGATEQYRAWTVGRKDG